MVKKATLPRASPNLEGWHLIEAVTSLPSTAHLSRPVISLNLHPTVSRPSSPPGLMVRSSSRSSFCQLHANPLTQRIYVYEKSNHTWFGTFRFRLDAGVLCQLA